MLLSLLYVLISGIALRDTAFRQPAYKVDKDLNVLE